MCSGVCKRTVLLETADELTAGDIAGACRIGVVAGASTPSGIIKEVLKTMDEMQTINPEAKETINDEMTFEEMLNATESNSNTDQKVKGTVLAVSPTEIQVDIGRKHTGYVTAAEFSSTPT